jgi:excisionase family DNA binding protein
MATAAHARDLLTVDEAAMELRLSSPTLRRLISEGIVPVVQLGGPGHAVRVRREDLDRLLEARSRVGE